jgi:WD40 repeat protein
MSRIFISHSSVNNLKAVAIKQWLESHKDYGWGPDEVFLDIEGGINPGQRWQEALRQGVDRCEAVICLISPAWLTSRYCFVEFKDAQRYRKPIFGVLIEKVKFDDIPREMTVEWQLCDLTQKGESQSFAVKAKAKKGTVKYPVAGLDELFAGLKKAGIGPGSFRLDPGRPPYPGLKPLEEEDAAIFFGRDTEILRAIDRIRGMRTTGPEQIMIVRGASGTGKSSFLRAGLLRRLRRDDRNFLPLKPLRPHGGAISGETGLGAVLEAALKGTRTRGAIVEELNTNPAALAKIVGELRSRQSSPSVVLSIDQAEELRDERGAAEAEQLLRHVTGALADRDLQNGGLLVLMTVRSDLYDDLKNGTPLKDLRTPSFDLQPMPATSFRDIIEKPAQVFEASGGKLQLKPGLVEAIAQDAAVGGIGTLPLLAFTLERLYTLHGKDGDLTLDEYMTLGRMSGAIRATVEDAVVATAAKDLRRIFIPRFATVDRKTRAPRREVAKLGKIPPEALPLIARLTEARLLTSDMRDGKPTRELAHDSLLNAWADLRGWLEEDQTLLALREAVREAALMWDSEGRNDDRLVHRGAPLKEAEALLVRPDLIFDQSMEYLYLSACRGREKDEADRREAAEREKRANLEKIAQEQARTARQQRSTKRALTAVGVVFGIGLLAVAFGGWLVVTLTGNFLDARARLVAEAAMVQQDGDHFDSSLRLALLAHKTADRPPIEASKEATFQQIEKLGTKHDGAKLSSAFSHSALAKALQATRQVATLNGHTAEVVSVAFSRDGSRIVTASWDNTARLWDAEGKEIAVLKGHVDRVTSAAFNADGSRIVTASADGTARLWDAEGKQIAVLKGREYDVTLRGRALGVNSAGFSADGNRIVTASENMTARLWDAKGKAIAVLKGHEGSVNSTAFNADGSRIVTASDDTTARLWDAEGNEIAVLKGHEGIVHSAAFNVDGSRIVTASDDNTARLWDATCKGECKEIAVLKGHQSIVTFAAFSANGSRIVTASWDSTARLWDAEGKEITVLNGHLDIVNSAAFNTDGSRIVTGSADGTARLWDAEGNEIGVLKGHEDDVRSAAFSADGSRIVTASFDTTARLWDATCKGECKEIAVLKGHENEVTSAAFNADGSRIVTASSDNTARLWDATCKGECKAIAVLKGHENEVTSAAFNADGSRIVTASVDKTARLWNAEGMHIAVLRTPRTITATIWRIAWA